MLLYDDDHYYMGGVLAELYVKEGDKVAKGQLLARLDDFKVGQTVKIGILRGKAKAEIAAVLKPGV